MSASAPKVHIVFGPLGAGKSTHARQLSIAEKATCFSIDNWMVDLFAPDSPVPLDLPWIMERVKRCEHRIWLTARDVVKNGGNVVLDLGFMKAANRREFLNLAHREDLQTQLHFITASRETRRTRVLARNHSKGATFAMEISPSMFDFMDTQFEAATRDELIASLVVDTDTSH